MASPSDMKRLEELFHQAAQLEGDARAEFMTQIRNATPGLADELAALIDAHGRTGSFLDSPAHEAAAHALAEDAPRFRAGQTLGRYEVLKAIGKGGMGEVYLARDLDLGRKVALKLLPAQFTDHGDRLKRFTLEARAASALNHPNIITIHEIGLSDGVHFIATEFIEGQTLRGRLHRDRPSLAEVLDIAIQITSAIEAAHAAGVVHRDIKPENIMLRSDGYVKVLDFGLAKLTESGESPAAPIDSGIGTAIMEGTRPGVIMGTPKYMSPEQARGHVLDSRSDIFSLGVVIYEMATGRAPFTGDTNMDVAVSILEKEPPSLSHFTPDVPVELERIVVKALRKDRRHRYQGARELLLDLKTLRDEIAFGKRLEMSRSPDGAKTADAPGGRRPVLWVSVAVLVAAVSMAGAFFWPRSHPASAPPATVAALSERSLRYWILVQKYREGRPYQDPIRLRDDINFEKDYRIRLNIEAPDSGYLYLLNEGPAPGGGAPSFVVMFPTERMNGHSARIDANQAIQIPEQSWFQFDAQEGTEKIWLVWSKTSVDEMEAAKAFANPRERGLVADSALAARIESFLASHASAPASVERSDTTAETLIREGGDTLVHVIKLSHH